MNPLLNSKTRVPCSFIVISLVLVAIVMCIGLTTKAHADENGKCSMATVVAKKAPKAPKDPTSSKPERVTIITLGVGAEPGQKIIPAPFDTGAATKGDPWLVESHTVMRLVAFTETD
jgi:hypothetical protein